MTETKTFAPITTQEEFDERIKARLAREREKWEKESGVEDLEAQLQAKDEEMQQLRDDHLRQDAERAVKQHLQSMGISEEGRVFRIMRHVDLAEVDLANPITVSGALGAVKRDLPELFEGRRVIGAGSGGSDKAVLEEKPLTREQVEQMSVEEQRKPGMKERIDRFLQGQR